MPRGRPKKTQVAQTEIPVVKEELLEEPSLIKREMVKEEIKKDPKIKYPYYVDLYRGIQIISTYQYRDEATAVRFAQTCRDEALKRRISRVRVHQTKDDKLIANYTMVVHNTKDGLRVLNGSD